MSVLDAAQRMIDKYGEPMILARGGEASTVTVKGKRIGGTTEPIGNSAAQQQFRVKISVGELAASAWAVKVPSAGTDTITIDGRARAVTDCRPLKAGETVGLYELDVAG